MDPVRGAPFHRQTQGKIERQIGAFVEYYDHQRHHESLNKVKPAVVYFGRDRAIFRQRKKIMRQTLEDLSL